MSTAEQRAQETSIKEQLLSFQAEAHCELFTKICGRVDCITFQVVILWRMAINFALSEAWILSPGLAPLPYRGSLHLEAELHSTYGTYSTERSGKSQDAQSSSADVSVPQKRVFNATKMKHLRPNIFMVQRKQLFERASQKKTQAGSRWEQRIGPLQRQEVEWEACHTRTPSQSRSSPATCQPKHSLPWQANGCPYIQW